MAKKTSELVSQRSITTDLIYTVNTRPHTTAHHPVGINALWGDFHVSFSTTKQAFDPKLGTLAITMPHSRTLATIPRSSGPSCRCFAPEPTSSGLSFCGYLLSSVLEKSPRVPKRPGEQNPKGLESRSTRYSMWAGSGRVELNLRLHNNKTFPDYLLPRIASLAALATRNLTTRFAAIWIVSPVAGFRPIRALRFTRTILPSPGIVKEFFAFLYANATRASRVCTACFFSQADGFRK